MIKWAAILAMVLSYSKSNANKIFPSQDIDSFADSVSISGNRALIGGVNAGTVNGSGAAYIFEFDGQNWIETQTLIAADFDFGDQFGSAVSILGNRAAVSAIEDDSGTGSVYIFEYDGNQWLETAKITSNDSQPDDNFGFSISLSSNKILIGAPFHDRAGGQFDTDTGAAYIYDYNGSTWQQTIKLTPANDVGGIFGNSVSLSGNWAVGGAPNDGLLSGAPGGSAYVYQFNGSSWIADDKLRPSDLADTAGFFGQSLSLSGEKIIVGDHINSKAYIYEFQADSWTETEIIIRNSDSLFAYSVSLSGDTALIGEPNDSNLKGKAYVYKRNGNDWVETEMLTATDGLQGDQYGFNVDFDGSNSIIGAPGGNSSDPNRPDAAYIYSMDTIFTNGFEGQ